MHAWYTHRWNSTTALRLILTIIPRTPRWLVPAVAVVTTAVCITYMKRERQAARRNLRRILGGGGWRLYCGVWRLFYNFSRFMVGYCDLSRLTAGQLRERVWEDPQGEGRIREALARGNGLIVLTAHVGNWEVGTRLLALNDARVNLVMRLERGNAAERWLTRIRQKDGVRLVRIGDGGDGAIALRAALARNEILAMQGDRTPGEHVLTPELFGAPFPLPLGPFLLAYACGAPLLPAFVLQDGWGQWRSYVRAPVRFPRTDDRGADLSAGALEYARELETVVRDHPDQWFNFYDLWPEAES